MHLDGARTGDTARQKTVDGDSGEAASPSTRQINGKPALSQFSRESACASPMRFPARERFKCPRSILSMENIFLVHNIVDEVI